MTQRGQDPADALRLREIQVGEGDPRLLAGRGDDLTPRPGNQAVAEGPTLAPRRPPGSALGRGDDEELTRTRKTTSK